MPSSLCVSIVWLKLLKSDQGCETSTVNWQTKIAEEQQKSYFHQIDHFLKDELKCGRHWYPSEDEIFRAFELTPLDRVKVVILGQDPYHGEGQAEGLAFSVKAGIKPPPSLRNIFKELERSIPGYHQPQNGSLVPWAKQGVLLLNTVLTVRSAAARSHHKIGWQDFTTAMLRYLTAQRQGVVFLLWGNDARGIQNEVDLSSQHILEAPHPSPLSAHRGFLGCDHFAEANRLLSAQGLDPVNWQT